MITAEQAIKRLYGAYGKFGVSKDLITRLFMDGIGQQGFTPLATYNLLRMSLGEEFEQQEYFSVKEIAEMLETSEEEVRQQIAQLQEQNGAKPIETMQGWQWYFPNGIK
jgi:phenylalanine-4-hydroxylase